MNLKYDGTDILEECGQWNRTRSDYWWPIERPLTNEEALKLLRDMQSSHRFMVGDILIQPDPQGSYMEESVRFTVTEADNEKFSVRRWDSEPGIRIPWDKAYKFRRVTP